MTEEFEQQEVELTDDNSSRESVQADDAAADEQSDEQADTQDNEQNENLTDANATSEQASETPSQNVTTDSVIEAILFATDEPLSAERLVTISQFNGGVKQVKKCIETLNKQYVETGRAFRIEEIAGGFQMMTLPEYNNWLKNLLRQRADNKLSPAALETLAIISYKQPIIRADIEAIRGVACGEIVRTLMYKGLVKIVGKAEILGRPLLYGTTKKFLQVFGLNDLKDLPKAEELKQPGQSDQ